MMRAFDAMESAVRRAHQLRAAAVVLFFVGTLIAVTAAPLLVVREWPAVWSWLAQRAFVGRCLGPGPRFQEQYCAGFTIKFGPGQ